MYSPSANPEGPTHRSLQYRRHRHKGTVNDFDIRYLCHTAKEDSFTSNLPYYSIINHIYPGLTALLAEGFRDFTKFLQAYFMTVS
jgi:hypothetical protein